MSYVYPSVYPSVPVQPARRTLQISQRHLDEGGFTVELFGELDYATGPELRAAVSEMLAARPLPSVIEIDLGGVTFMDSTGLGTLVVACRICADLGIRPILRNPSRFVAELLDVSGVRDRLPGAAR